MSRFKSLLLALPLALAIAAPASPQGFPGPYVKDAGPNDVRVIVTFAVKGPLDTVLKEASEAIGRPIVAEYGSARGNLKDKILEGQDFEVAILLPDVDEAILKAGKVDPGTYRIAVVPTGLAVRGEGPPPDVSTPEALRQTLLEAKAVKYSPTGAALDTVRNVLDKLDVADKIHDVSKTGERVELASGEYEINIFPISEIIPNKALTNLGPVIPELQIPFALEATVGKNARDKDIACKLIAFLQGHAIDPGLKAAGMIKDTTNSK